MSHSSIYLNSAAKKAKHIEWVHVYPGKQVPPTFDGSFNHLLWQILERHGQRHLFVGKFYEESFKLAEQNNVPVIQIDFQPSLRLVDKLGRYFREAPPLTMHPFMDTAFSELANYSFENILIWGDYRFLKHFRRRFPNKTIAYAQRFFEEPFAKASDYNAADILLLLSEGIAKFAYQKFYDFYPTVVILPNGVELTQFRPVSPNQKAMLRRKLNLPEDKRIVLYPSKIHGKKGANYLYRWLLYCEQEMPELHFVIIGQVKGNQERGDKGKLIRHLSQAKNASRLGTVARTEMPQLYQMADMALIPSVTREGMSMAALEAMACGVPLVAPNRGIFPEIIDHLKTGYLCKTEHLYVDGLQAFKLLGEDEALRDRLGQQARIYTEERLSRQKCLDNWTRFFADEWHEINANIKPINYQDYELADN